MPLPEQQEYFMRLYSPMHVRLSRYISSLVYDKEAAKDIQGEAVLLAYEKIAKLQNEEVFPYFVIGIASRLVKQYHRQRKLKSWIGLASVEHIPEKNAQTEHRAEMYLLHRLLLLLNHKEREALVLFEINGFSLKEIREIQGDSLSAVKSRLVRSRQKLAQMLSSAESERVPDKNIRLQGIKTDKA